MENFNIQTLKNLGFNSCELTENQKEILLQPFNAPENFYHDGEVTPDEAVKIWSLNLLKEGLSYKQVKIAVRNL